MDPLDWMEPEQLREFFHRHKTEMSCMENTHMFLCQLRDYNLVPEDTYQKMSRMKSKESMRKALYDVLDRLERKDHIMVFWECVFKEHILTKYPYLKMLRNSLFDGSSRLHTQLPERVEKEEPVEKQATSVTRKRKLRAKSFCEEDEDSQPGPSSLLSRKKKSKKISFSSPIKKGEKNDIWTWKLYKSQLPVTCGSLKGTLVREKLSKGEKCILFDKQWFTPKEFERFAGKKKNGNWRRSIHCGHAHLGKLIKEGHLTAASYTVQKKKGKESSSPSDDLATDTEGENEKTDEDSSSNSWSSTPVPDEVDKEGEMGVPQLADSQAKQVFSVTCGDADGKLHSNRFASGTRGKSIRTQTRWVTPTEFVRGASSVSNPSWQRDIQWEGKPLGVLIETGMLKMHLVNCDENCQLCFPDEKDLENQDNDDECCVCRSAEDGEELVVCDHCPYSFHQMCHLPNVDDSILRDKRPWMCTFCIYKTTQKWRYSDEQQREVAMSRQISQSQLECQYLVLYLYSHDEMQPFATNPSLLLKDYTKVIKTPMWLGEVADKLQRHQYKTVGEFVSDVQLIFTNCASYNKHNAEFLDMGSRLKEVFETTLQDVFKIP